MRPALDVDLQPGQEREQRVDPELLELRLVERLERRPLVGVEPELLDERGRVVEEPTAHGRLHAQPVQRAGEG